MRKTYMPPEADIEKFSLISVITASNPDPGGQGAGDSGDTEF